MHEGMDEWKGGRGGCRLRPIAQMDVRMRERECVCTCVAHLSGPGKSARSADAECCDEYVVRVRVCMYCCALGKETRENRNNARVTTHWSTQNSAADKVMNVKRQSQQGQQTCKERWPRMRRDQAQNSTSLHNCSRVQYRLVHAYLRSSLLALATCQPSRSAALFDCSDT